jgi:HD superfamily phosphodiesterase
MADWLMQLKTEFKEITLPLARKFWPGKSPDDEPYYNYRYMHVEQVERDARRLMAVYGGDEDIVLASVWIHDWFKPQFGGEDHAERAAEWAEENLVKKGFPAAKVPGVVYALANHTWDHFDIPEERKEARILWDADKLGKSGALGITYLLCNGESHSGRKMGFAEIIQKMRRWEELARKLSGEFYFPLSRDIGKKKWAILKAFCDALEEETGVKP